MHYEGRDAELGELVMGSNGGCDPQTERRRDPTIQAIANIKSIIDSGRGIGEATVYKIVKHRRLKMSGRTIGETDVQPDDKSVSLRAIREALATLKASGEHDRIIADEAGNAAAKLEAEALAAKEGRKRDKAKAAEGIGGSIAPPIKRPGSN